MNSWYYTVLKNSVECQKLSCCYTKSPLFSVVVFFEGYCWCKIGLHAMLSYSDKGMLDSGKLFNDYFIAKPGKHVVYTRMHNGT